MKKGIAVALVLVMLSILLTGCSRDVPAPMRPNTEPTQSLDEETKTPTEIKEPIIGIPMPQKPKGTFAEFDPSREYYILTGGADATKYGGRYTYTFQMMSKQELGSEDISVQLSCKNEYSYEVIPHQVDYRGTEYENGTGNTFLPFYVYQNYRGVDFSLAGKLYSWYTNPPEEGTEEAAEMEAVTEGQSPKILFDELVNKGVEDFVALQAEDTREFYLYDVRISFVVTEEETITEMNVMIDGQRFDKEIGSLHLIPDVFPSRYSYPTEDCWADRVYPGTYYQNTLYGKGIVQAFVFEVIATEDIYLEEFLIHEEDYELLNIVLQVTSGGTTMTSSWDGETPYAVYSGDHVYIEVIVQNDLFAQLNYSSVMYYELIFSVDGVKYSDYNSPTFRPNLNYHEVYAIVFDGLDMQSYYQDYYYPIYEQWQKEYE